jgi:hypothetical protein
MRTITAGYLLGAEEAAGDGGVRQVAGKAFSATLRATFGVQRKNRGAPSGS